MARERNRIQEELAAGTSGGRQTKSGLLGGWFGAGNAGVEMEEDDQGAWKMRLNKRKSQHEEDVAVRKWELEKRRREIALESHERELQMLEERAAAGCGPIGGHDAPGGYSPPHSSMSPGGAGHYYHGAPPGSPPPGSPPNMYPPLYGPQAYHPGMMPGYNVPPPPGGVAPAAVPGSNLGIGGLVDQFAYIQQQQRIETLKDEKTLLREERDYFRRKMMEQDRREADEISQLRAGRSRSPSPGGYPGGRLADGERVLTGLEDLLRRHLGSEDRGRSPGSRSGGHPQHVNFYPSPRGQHGLVPASPGSAAASSYRQQHGGGVPEQIVQDLSKLEAMRLQDTISRLSDEMRDLRMQNKMQTMDAQSRSASAQGKKQQHEFMFYPDVMPSSCSSSRRERMRDAKQDRLEKKIDALLNSTTGGQLELLNSCTSESQHPEVERNRELRDATMNLRAEIEAMKREKLDMEGKLMDSSYSFRRDLETDSGTSSKETRQRSKRLGEVADMYERVIERKISQKAFLNWFQNARFRQLSRGVAETQKAQTQVMQHLCKHVRSDWRDLRQDALRELGDFGSALSDSQMQLLGTLARKDRWSHRKNERSPQKSSPSTTRKSSSTSPARIKDLRSQQQPVAAPTLPLLKKTRRTRQSTSAAAVSSAGNKKPRGVVDKEIQYQDQEEKNLEQEPSATSSNSESPSSFSESSTPDDDEAYPVRSTMLPNSSSAAATREDATSNRKNRGRKGRRKAPPTGTTPATASATAPASPPGDVERGKTKTAAATRGKRRNKKEQETSFSSSPKRNKKDKEKSASEPFEGLGVDHDEDVMFYPEVASDEEASTSSDVKVQDGDPLEVLERVDMKNDRDGDSDSLEALLSGEKKDEVEQDVASSNS
ncbi:unnamed protein product [Amoebophrya sp. A25]|nr:unnamed protein product [Amoebophrya sp. A25]|eukprot:GSA25T00013056001.1